MNVSRYLLALVFAGAALLTAGCNTHTRVARHVPPPPQMSQDHVAAIARANGFRDGRKEGRYDAQHARTPEPRRDHMYRSYPGWNPEMGAQGVYRDIYQEAFVRGYQEAYGRRTN